MKPAIPNKTPVHHRCLKEKCGKTQKKRTKEGNESGPSTEPSINRKCIYPGRTRPDIPGLMVQPASTRPILNRILNKSWRAKTYKGEAIKSTSNRNWRYFAHTFCNFLHTAQFCFMCKSRLLILVVSVLKVSELVWDL